MNRSCLLVACLAVLAVASCRASPTPSSKADLAASVGEDRRNADVASTDDREPSNEEIVFDPNSPEAQARYAFLAQYDGLRGAEEFLRGDRQVDERTFRRIVPDKQQKRYLEQNGQDRNRAYQAFMVDFLNREIDLHPFTSGPTGPDRGLLRPVLSIDDVDDSAVRLADVAKSRKDCIEAASSVGENFGCDWTAIYAIFPILSRTKANDDLKKLFETLERPFNLKLSDRGDSQVVALAVGSAFADLAQARAAILTESEVMIPYVPAGSISPGRQLGWMDGRSKAVQYWATIRREDCKAYPVPHCAERLDAALSDLIDREAMQGAAIMLHQ